MQNLFSKYFQGKCSKEEYLQILEFIKNRKNDLFLDGLLLSKWKEIKQQEIQIEPDSKVLNSIHHNIALEESGRYVRIIRNYRIALSIAAMFVVAFIAGMLYYSDSFTPEITMQTYSTPYGGKMEIELPDGSQVWLNGGSELTFPNRFADTRTVKLSGEAFFDVETKPESFVVESPYGNIKVHGTEFNVKAYEEGDFAATLEEGSVSFASPSGSEVTLKPGEQVFLDNNKYKLKTVETELYTSWKDGRLIFHDEPLEKMISRLERWYNVKIELSDKSVKDLKFNGTIEMESFSEVLELIKVTTPINYSFNRDTRVLTITAK